MQCGLSTLLSKAVVHGLSYATFCPNMHFRVRRFFATGMHMQGMPEIPDLWRTLTLQFTQSKNTLTNASFFMIWLPVDFITGSLSCHLLAAKTIHRLMRGHPHKTWNFILSYIQKRQKKLKNSSTYFWRYSKASRYTASSCTDLDNAHFWIGSKKIWDTRIHVVKTLSCTFILWSCLCLIK